MKVHVVMRTAGDWGDRSSWVCCVHADERRANECAVENQKAAAHLDSPPAYEVVEKELEP